jgi:hypothetical protein
MLLPRGTDLLEDGLEGRRLEARARAAAGVRGHARLVRLLVRRLGALQARQVERQQVGRGLRGVVGGCKGGSWGSGL